MQELARITAALSTEQAAHYTLQQSSAKTVASATQQTADLRALLQEALVDAAAQRDQAAAAATVAADTANSEVAALQQKLHSLIEEGFTSAAQVQELQQQLQAVQAAAAEAAAVHAAEAQAAGAAIRRLEESKLRDAQAAARAARTAAAEREADTAAVAQSAAAAEQWRALSDAVQGVCAAVDSATAATSGSAGDCSAKIQQCCQNAPGDAPLVSTVKAAVTAAVRRVQHDAHSTADARCAAVEQQLQQLRNHEAATAAAAVQKRAQQSQLVAKEIERLRYHSTALRQQLGEHCREPVVARCSARGIAAYSQY